MSPSTLALTRSDIPLLRNMRRIIALHIFLMALFISFPVLADADVCTVCEYQGCLASFEKLSSVECKSCQISLEEERPKPRDDEDKGEEENAPENVNSFSNILFGFLLPLKTDEGQKVKDCGKDEWKNDASCEDLTFQESMADSAESIIGLTRFQIILSALGLGGILWSLIEARRANKIAYQALSGNRAWLGFDEFKQDIQFNADGIGVNAVEVRCKIRNSGKSPATEVSIENGFATGGNSREDCLTYLEANRPVAEDRMAVPPNGISHTNSVFIQEEQFNEIIGGNCVIIVIVKYKDGFSDEFRRTEIYVGVTITIITDEQGRIVPRLDFPTLVEREAIMT